MFSRGFLLYRAGIAARKYHGEGHTEINCQACLVAWVKYYDGDPNDSFDHNWIEVETAYADTVRTNRTHPDICPRCESVYPAYIASHSLAMMGTLGKPTTVVVCEICNHRIRYGK